MEEGRNPPANKGKSYRCRVFGERVRAGNARDLRKRAKELVNRFGDPKKTYHVTVTLNGRPHDQMALCRFVRCRIRPL